MSARWQPDEPLVEPIGLGELDVLMAIERQAYPHPWSRGNFVDSLVAGYLARKRVTPDGRWLGYFIAMAGPGEMHLLNLTVDPVVQRQGHGWAMLDELVRLARGQGARCLWLEVRTSNAPAQALYRRYGFAEVGRRRGYYPAELGAREDALVMNLPLVPGGGDALV